MILFTEKQGLANDIGYFREAKRGNEREKKRGVTSKIRYHVFPYDDINDEQKKQLYTYVHSSYFNKVLRIFLDTNSMF